VLTNVNILIRIPSRLSGIHFHGGQTAKHCLEDLVLCPRTLIHTFTLHLSKNQEKIHQPFPTHLSAALTPSGYAPSLV